ncbi:hypothetical protein PUMCH_001449 [Australozyma saopauloensis]|uniref:Uncharacterized protein n=1 Tax=Australozyma saopauloensis TaxID=291208 RepID=A0AAX4H6P1_9ASCO|nr:hypothetical protein PUMCH_001449 [[Candida] saopauloensis]
MGSSSIAPEKSVRPERFRPALITCPWIRETVYAHTFQIRLKHLATYPNLPSLGPSDLINWGRHYGERSSKFTLNEFGVDAAPDGLNKDADGYVGYYHFSNGIDYLGGVLSMEQYLLGSVGLVYSEGLYVRGSQCLVGLSGTSQEKPMILTLCAYNVFSRAELRMRANVAVPKGTNPSFKLLKPAKALALPVDVSVLFSVYYVAEQRTVDYTKATISELPQSFWDELAALSLIRLFLCSDDPSKQLSGTVNLPDMVVDRESLAVTLALLVNLLPKGHMAGTRESYGSVTLAGQGPGLLLKLTTYRNYLVDSLVRVVSLDSSGNVAEDTISLIQAMFGHNFDYVVCQLLKTQHTRNNTARFLNLLHDFFAFETLLCQAALLLTEQARFLIGQNSIDQAKYLAARAVAILPLDFDSWYHLALCYVLERDFVRALDTINSLCVVIGPSVGKPFDVNGTPDTYASRFVEHSARGKGIDLRTFENYFRPPVDEKNVEIASMDHIWHRTFQYDLSKRRPITGLFYTSALDLASPKEASVVSYEVHEVLGPNSTKLATAAKSAKQQRASVLDFERRSTWGRVYDLLTTLVALIGWENLAESHYRAFTSQTQDTKNYVVDHGSENKKPISPWFQQLFTVVYEDLKAMASLNGAEHRSVLAWEMTGFLGWGCKFNLRETISALITSSSTATEGHFHYFSTVKLLEIYNEFVLSDITSSALDTYSSAYDGCNYTNKLIVKYFSPQVYQEFVRLLGMGNFTLENVLMHLVKLCSWNVRWYGYMPPYIVVETLQKLCIKFEIAVVRETLRIMFVKYHKGKEKQSGAFTLKEMFAPPKQNEGAKYEFESGDTIPKYMELLIDWVEEMSDHERSMAQN